MKLSLIATTALLSAVLLAAPVPASARDMCMQMAGVDCDFSGESGFFRLMKFRMPKNPRKAVPVHGRVAGLNALYGTAVMTPDESHVNIAASFVQDGLFGTVNIEIYPDNLFHPASSAYGDVNLGASGDCQAWFVSCEGEPQ